MPTEREHTVALDDALKEIDLIRFQLNEARLHSRTTRFYEILLRRSNPNERAHVGDAIELSAGWCVVHWILSSRRSIDLYKSVDALRVAMAIDGLFILSLVDVSEDLDPFGTKARGKHRPHISLNSTEQLALIHLCHGLTNKEIAAKLGMVESTIKNALGRAYKKLHVQTRTEAAIMVRDLTLLPDYDG